MEESEKGLSLRVTNGPYLESDQLGELLGDLTGRNLNFSGKDVTLSGKAPNGFYTHLAYLAAPKGARAVRVVQQPSREEIEGYQSDRETEGRDLRRLDWISVTGTWKVTIRFNAPGGH